MAELFGRDWLITVDTLRTSGLDCSFSITKDTTRKPNKCSLEVFNLPREFRDHLDGLSVRGKKAKGRIRVELEAGYQGSRSLIFRGDLRTAESTQHGGTWSTKLEGEDGGRALLQSRVSRGYPPGTPVLTVVRDCAAALGVGLGNVEALATRTTRGGATFRQGTTLSGNAAEELTGVLRSCGLTWSVQDGVLSVLQAGQAVATTAVRLSAGTGLVDTPKPSPDGTISARALIVPGLYPGGRVFLDTDRIRGTFGIKRIVYKGDTAGRDWYADLVLRRDDGST